MLFSAGIAIYRHCTRPPVPVPKGALQVHDGLAHLQLSNSKIQAVYEFLFSEPGAASLDGSFRWRSTFLFKTHESQSYHRKPGVSNLPPGFGA